MYGGFALLPHSLLYQISYRVDIHMDMHINETMPCQNHQIVFT